MYIHTLASFHVDNASKVLQTIEAGVEAEPEAEDPEVVCQEEQQQELEAAEQVEELDSESNFANSEPQPGKHRCMINPVPFSFESYNYYYLCIKFIGVV